MFTVIFQPVYFTFIKHQYLFNLKFNNTDHGIKSELYLLQFFWKTLVERELQFRLNLITL